MPRMLHAGITVTLPPDEFAAAEVMTKLQPHWATFIAAAKEAGARFEQELKTSETKAPGPRRTRKPRPPSAESSTAALLDSTAFDAEIAA
jgi:hypothetical protein